MIHCLRMESHIPFSETHALMLHAYRLVSAESPKTPERLWEWEKAHSIEFSGGVGHCSSKASRREDLEIEQPVACWDCASFHFHPTLATILGAPLIRYQVVEVC